MKRKLWLVLILLIVLLAAGWKVADLYLHGVSSQDSEKEIGVEEEPIDYVVEEERHIPDNVDEAYLEELRSDYQQATLVMGDVSAAAGEQVTVQVLVVHNPGILGMSGTLSYDDSVMTLESAVSGAAVSEVLDFTVSDTLNSGCRFLWDGLDIQEEQIKDGTVMELTFQISDTAQSGKYPITLTLDTDSVVNRDLAPLELDVDSGYLIIS